MAGSKTDVAELGWLNLLFNNIDFAGIGDAGGLRGSVAAGSLEVSAHTAEPGEGADQTTSEVNYGGDARAVVARTAGGWIITQVAGTTSAKPTSPVPWPVCTSGSSSIAGFGIGTSHTGAGKLLYYGPLTPTINVTQGITPQIPAAGLDIGEA